MYVWGDTYYENLRLTVLQRLFSLLLDGIKKNSYKIHDDKQGKQGISTDEFLDHPNQQLESITKKQKNLCTHHITTQYNNLYK